MFACAKVACSEPASFGNSRRNGKKTGGAGETQGPILSQTIESGLTAAQSLTTKTADRTYAVNLVGGMHAMNGVCFKRRYSVRPGERVIVECAIIR